MQAFKRGLQLPEYDDDEDAGYSALIVPGLESPSGTDVESDLTNDSGKDEMHHQQIVAGLSQCSVAQLVKSCCAAVSAELLKGEADLEAMQFLCSQQQVCLGRISQRVELLAATLWTQQWERHMDGGGSGLGHSSAAFAVTSVLNVWTQVETLLASRVNNAQGWARDRALLHRLTCSGGLSEKLITAAEEVDAMHAAELRRESQAKRKALNKVSLVEATMPGAESEGGVLSAKARLSVVESELRQLQGRIAQLLEDKRLAIENSDRAVQAHADVISILQRCTCGAEVRSNTGVLKRKGSGVNILENKIKVLERDLEARTAQLKQSADRCAGLQTELSAIQQRDNGESVVKGSRDLDKQIIATLKEELTRERLAAKKLQTEFRDEQKHTERLTTQIKEAKERENRQDTRVPDLNIAQPRFTLLQLVFACMCCWIAASLSLSRIDTKGFNVS